MGSLPGSSVVPMMPPSSTMVRFGACRCRATAEASSGMPTPAKTTLWSASSRLAVIAISSSAVISLIACGISSPASAASAASRAGPAAATKPAKSACASTFSST